MSYIKQSLTPDEQLIHIGRFHWMYSVNAILSILSSFFICVGILWASIFFMENYWSYFTRTPFQFQSETGIGKLRELHPAIKLLVVMIFALGLLRFAHMMVIQVTTEIAVTTSRIVYKRGLVARYVGEMSIDRIEGVNVLQTVFGRIFNYGRIMVRGMGVGEVILPPIADPIKFRRAIEVARTA